MSKATVIYPGFFTTIQDLGRNHYRNVGVPQSGAMDLEMSGHLNDRLGNDPNAAVLEMTQTGVTLSFDAPAVVAISQNCERVYIDDIPVRHDKSISIYRGAVMKIGRASYGNFMYLAIKGGWLTPKVLGSRSYYTGITTSHKISKNDVLAYKSTSAKIDIDISRVYHNSKPTLEWYPGPEIDVLSSNIMEQLLGSSLTVSSQWNRMVFAISTSGGDAIPSISTVPVQPGTIQLTAAGTLLILMRDAQTTGGYPRVGQLTRESINYLAQCTTGTVLKWRLMNL